MGKFTYFLAFLLLAEISISNGAKLGGIGSPTAGRRRGNTFTPGMDTSINSNGRNLVIPSSRVNSLDPNNGKILLSRAEATPNQRLHPGGLADTRNKFAFVSIGNQGRSEDFMQQARWREGQKTPGNTNLENFKSSGQTIRSGLISRDSARRILSSSVPERLNEVTNTQRRMGFSPDVKNVDITKSYNQVGIRGPLLGQVKNELSANGVSQGTTYLGRRRSEPNIVYRPFLTIKPLPRMRNIGS